MTQDIYPSRISDQPEMLPRQDPVVHGQWSAEAPLSQDAVRSYEEKGFLVLEDVFDAGEVELLKAESARLCGAGRDQLEDGTAFTEPNSGDVRSVFKIHQQSPVFSRLAADARLAEVARFLLGDDVYIHQSRLNYKPGFEGKDFYWHSDFETWHVEDGMPRMRALSMSVLLTENTPHNGPLMLIPGSHKRYVACVGETPEDHYKQSLKKQEYGVPDHDSLSALAAEGGIEAPIGKPGTVVIFDCNTMHGSNGNITPFARSNAFMVFNAVSNKLVAPFGPKTPRPEFIAARESTPVIQPVQGRLTLQAA
ncbi:MAG TPA: ectoine hydroxylase [Hyphomicrobiales bacterium]|nr:ectoine hydroxylase [Hyphomicrobiales bacterium]